MQKSNVVILPVRLTPALYEQLASLAVHENRSRCNMLRQLIIEAAARQARKKGER